MTADNSVYHARLEAAAGDETSRAIVRDDHELKLDEPTWSDRGTDRAPCPIDYLLVGVAGCQLESLRQCLEKSRVDDYHVDMSVEGKCEIAADRESGVPEPTSNALTAILLSIEVTTAAEHEGRVERCLEIVEDRGCIASRSVEGGVDVPLRTSVDVRTEGGDRVTK